MAALVDGPAGIGKTTVWRAAITAAEASGWQVAVVRPRESEAGMPFAGLQGLLADRLDEVAMALPTPQRAALDVALFRAAPSRRPITAHLVATATLSALRAISDRGRFLLAVDDAQWLDRASADALRFALRRLDGDRVRVLVTWRSTAGRLDLGLDEDQIVRIHVGGLSAAELRRVVNQRLAVTIPMSAAKQLAGLTGGNPFYALELVRSRPDGDYLFSAGTLQVDDVRALLGERFSALPRDTVRALAIISAMDDPTLQAIDRGVADEAALDAAFRSGVLVMEAGRLHFAHPLLAAAAYASVSPQERREIHRRLADLAAGVEERARHLAVATLHPDADIAAALDAGAAAAAARGATLHAAMLLNSAASLTPPAHTARCTERRLAAARWFFAAGENGKGTDICRALAEQLPPGDERAEALTMMAWRGLIDTDQAIAMCEQAVADSSSARIRVRSMVRLSNVVSTQDMHRALAIAREAADLARNADDEVALCNVLPVLGAYLALTDPAAQGVDVLRQAVALEDQLGVAVEDSYLSARSTLGMVLFLRDEFDEARSLLRLQYDTAVANGDQSGAMAGHLIELECRAGHLATALRLADQALGLADEGRDTQILSAVLFARALVAAHDGDVALTRALALRSIEMGRAVGDRVIPLVGLAVLGFLELSLGDPAAALRWMESLPDQWRRTGYAEPGVTLFAQDRTEALISVGRGAEAEADLAGWEDLGRILDRPRLLATGARCRGLLAASRGDLPSALQMLYEAVEHCERLPSPHQRARTLLSLGSVLRRAGRRTEARARLAEALATFTDIGEPRWVDRTRAEIARLGGRTPAGNRLTHGEHRVAELVADGRTNQQVAAALSLTVRTVEANLTRIYTKLGLHSRAELAARWHQISATN